MDKLSLKACVAHGMTWTVMLQDLMLFCDGCDKGYHTNCHEPQVKEKPSGTDTNKF